MLRVPGDDTASPGARFWPQQSPTLAMIVDVSGDSVRCPHLAA